MHYNLLYYPWQLSATVISQLGFISHNLLLSMLCSQTKSTGIYFENVNYKHNQLPWAAKLVHDEVIMFHSLQSLFFIIFCPHTLGLVYPIIMQVCFLWQIIHFPWTFLCFGKSWMSNTELTYHGLKQKTYAHKTVLNTSGLAAFKLLLMK